MPVPYGYGSILADTKVSFFLPWINGIACYANCDGSTTAPVLNVLDFNCFVNRFTAGCP